MVSGKAQPFLDKSSGGGHWIGGISPLECHGSFLVQLGVKEAGQNGDLWIGGVGGKWDGESLFGVLPLVWVEGRLAGQKSPPSHGEVSEVSSGDWLCEEVLAGRLNAGLESGGWF